MSIYRTTWDDDTECGWGRCRAKPAPGIGICRRHAVRAFMWIRSQIPTLEELAAAGDEQAQQTLGARANNPWRRGVVYAIKFGPLLKLGFSSNFENRLLALPHDEILGTMPGTLSLERAIHKTFVEYKGEWYVDAPEIREFIAENMTPYESG